MLKSDHLHEYQQPKSDKLATMLGESTTNVCSKGKLYLNLASRRAAKLLEGKYDSVSGWHTGIKLKQRIPQIPKRQISI